MKSAAVLYFASSALAAGTLEFALLKQAKPQPNSNSSRRDVFETSLFTDFGRAYFLNISVGTPSQLQTVVLDTGSSDLFVTSSTAAYCQNHTCMGGTFDMSKSSTAQIVAPDALNNTFVDGSSDVGDLISDVVRIRDRVITNVTMGLARNVKPHTFQSGLLGVGYSLAEGSATLKGIRYPNFVETLVNAGEIASRFYSLYLSNLGQYGSIIFGGVDTQKFEGDLVTLNCMPAHGYVYDFGLSMPNVTMVDENGTTVQLVNETNAQYGVFDSGSSPWVVERTIFNRIVDLTGFVYSPEQGVPLLPCVEVSNTTAFDFQFRGARGNNATQANLRVLLSQMVIPVILPKGPLRDPSGNTYCFLPILPSRSNSGNIWGDAIMRAGYFVFDLDNGQVSLGQARHGDESKIVGVQAGPHGLASAINQPQYAQTVQTYTPAPPATDFSRSASVSTADITIGVASMSTATDYGWPESSPHIIPASVSWSNVTTDSSTTFSTSLVVTGTTSRTTPTLSSITWSTPSATSGPASDTSVVGPNVTPHVPSSVSSTSPNGRPNPDGSPFRIT